jgi:hypothetical protein
VYILVYHICKSIFDSYGSYESWWWRCENLSNWKAK